MPSLSHPRIETADRSTAVAFPAPGATAGLATRAAGGIMAAMHELIARCLAPTPRQLVRGGLAMFFLGTGILFAALAAQVALAESAWFIPEGALGYTAAATLVCWGVWAMGAGLRQARETAADGARSLATRRR